MEQATTHMMAFRFLDTPATQDAGFALMRELRPHLRDSLAFTEQLARQQRQGYCLLGAWQGEQVVGLIGYRSTENLLYGRFIYVDDLVVDPRLRQHGVGAMLIDAVREEARQQGCRHFVLDTGLHMALAQRFYFRQGLLARGMHFVQPLEVPQVTQHA